MKRNRNICLFVCLCLFISVLIWFVVCYPMTKLKNIEIVNVKTPNTDIYKDDCLHPCIRCYEDSFLGYKYWMVQSPYYAKNNQIENPILYRSNDMLNWDNGIEVESTPQSGYNSDPCIYREDSLLYIFWRECYTPFCLQNNAKRMTVGVSTKDGKVFSDKKIYLVEREKETDREQCPILVKEGNDYWFYCAWYEYIPERKSRGVARWKGTSLEEPNFVLEDTVLVESPVLRDRWISTKCFGKRIFFPKPITYDLWHFDLYRRSDTLFMVSCSNGSDNIMLYHSLDGKDWVVNNTPLINNHALENTVGYRQTYYKPTAFVENDTTHLFFTSQDMKDSKRNILWHASFMDLNMIE